MSVQGVLELDEKSFRDPAFTSNREAPVHRWVPWIAGYSKHFVADAIARYANSRSIVLDPFAGVGTTLIEADLAGHEVIGFEINPYAAFAAQTKLNAHRVSPDCLRKAVQGFGTFMRSALRKGRMPHSKPPQGFRTRSPFYSPRVQHKVLLALDFIGEQDTPIADLFRLAFAASMVEYSNYSYEPSLGRKVTVGRPEVEDFQVTELLAKRVSQMADDVDWYRHTRLPGKRRDGRIIEESFFDGYQQIEEHSVDLLITSPPYLNNYHYNRNTRPHLYWLGYCSSPQDFKRLEKLNFGTYWQNARDQEYIELDPSIEDVEIRQTIESVRQKNPEKGIYGGTGWANYAAHYFNDCLRFVNGANWCLRSGATALVVIGNSILQGVPVPTDQFLARIAEASGFKIVGIHVPREARVGSSIVDSSVRAGSGNGHGLYEAIVEMRRL
ncbi:MAG: DNA methyltransferase [Chloroflexota bacterium]|nr:DNA methyltransferase [Chloroflexota bacterium]